MYITLVILYLFQFCVAQNWWNFEDITDQLRYSPAFTPLPDKRFTHETVVGEFGTQLNDVEVNIPKAGFGNFMGYSTRVDYDYTWSQWPAEKGRLVNVFLGIPYAAPPTGDERFRLPRAAYLDTRFTWYAKRYKPACMQNKRVYQQIVPGFTDFSEDCLYLNIFYPNRTWEPPTTRYPVVVHIHGGSFLHGSSNNYPGHALASMGVVVVTFNYRLGIFGYLSTGDFASQGNYGMWDQLQAFTWVRDNIWWFKGDPTKITLMGESAGAASIGLHLISPASQNRNLFHQVIMMSGSDLSPWAVNDPDIVRPQYYAKEVGRRLGCPTDDHYALVYCLRYYKDLESLNIASLNISPLPGAPGHVWTPIVDGTVGFLPRLPRFERAMGHFQKMPIMAGIVHDEASFPANNFLYKWFGESEDLMNDLSEETFRNAIKKFLNYTNAQRIDETAEELYLRYTWWSNPNNMSARKEEFIAMFSDYFITAAVYATIRSHAIYSPNVSYFYEFAYRGLNDTSLPVLGIYHGVEIPFIFGFPFMNKSWWTKEMHPNPPLYKAANQIWNYPYDTNMSEFSMMLWTNFIKMSEPTPWEIQNVTWLPFMEQDENYLHIYINSSLHQKYRQSHMAFWRERYTYIAEIEPGSPPYYYYPVFDVQILTYILIIILIFLIIGIIILAVALCRRPDPDEFVETAGVDGDQFVSVFKDTFAGYGVESTDV